MRGVELTPTKVRGIVEVDPERDDFFKVIVEERLRLSSRRARSDIESKRLEKTLKIFASATCYGIYAQRDRQGQDDKVEVKCRGIDPDPYSRRVVHPEFAGELGFSPLASLITGGARLMLALLDRCISDLHGTYVMEDTDSMAIVATEHGGLVPCPEGPFRNGRWPRGCQGTVTERSRRGCSPFCEAQSVCGQVALDPQN